MKNYSDEKTCLIELKRATDEFAKARKWERFHNIKDLMVALGIEVSELQEIFLWRNGDDLASTIESKREAIEFELADIFNYLLQISNKLDIDLAAAFAKKLPIIAEKYPIEKCLASEVAI